MRRDRRMSGQTPIAIVGGGLAGSLLAIMLAKRGLRPQVLEKQPRYDEARAPGGRSINLALAARGIHALTRAGIYSAIEPMTIAMHGRMIHEIGRSEALRPYGLRSGERIYSISRAALNLELFRIAERLGVEYRFGCECVGVDAETGRAIVDESGRRGLLSAAFVIAADGAGSAARRGLQALAAVDAREDLLDHAYMELELPPRDAGGFALDPHALHIWPRSRFMLIALPNPGGSFTATLFLPRKGATSFASVAASGIGPLFAAEFPDAGALIPDLEHQYASRSTGLLGTVYCRPWSYRNRIVLIGDAAHAIVPFHGQGMNAAFEDCAEIDRLIGRHGTDWARIAEQFESRRRADCLAIAEMALENYAEMRDLVRDPKFLLRDDLSRELERRFPDRFIRRYSMVMFHPEIPYAEAQRRGEIQARLVDELVTDVVSVDQVNFERAARLVEQRL
jgi:kynurenine 3-monooxygenase